jgi:phosphatidylethanolamine-binding protein (PEBP) family uncharacterized protein
MAVTDYIEFVLATLLSGVRGHEAGILVKTPPTFNEFPEPTITVTSPLGPSGSDMPISHTQDGEDLYPELNWTNSLSDVKEYLVICEDVDAPLPSPINHGIFYSIPGTKVDVKNDDLTELGEGNLLKGGFRYGVNLRKVVYKGPRALKVRNRSLTQG